MLLRLKPEIIGVSFWEMFVILRFLCPLSDHPTKARGLLSWKLPSDCIKSASSVLRFLQKTKWTPPCFRHAASDSVDAAANVAAGDEGVHAEWEPSDPELCWRSTSSRVWSRKASLMPSVNVCCCRCCCWCFSCCCCCCCVYRRFCFSRCRFKPLPSGARVSAFLSCDEIPSSEKAGVKIFHYSYSNTLLFYLRILNSLYNTVNYTFSVREVHKQIAFTYKIVWNCHSFINIRALITISLNN